MTSALAWTSNMPMSILCGLAVEKYLSVVVRTHLIDMHTKVKENATTNKQLME